MKPTYPPRLQSGDEIRVVSPATSLNVIPADQRETSVNRLEGLGLRVTFSQHVSVVDEFNSSPVDLRVRDLHAAFTDSAVKGILTTLGGYNSNQLLRYLDYSLIRANPKVLCGFSDITALAVAIYAKTGLVTYSGPHFSTFGMVKGIDYTLEMFRRCLMTTAPVSVNQAPDWSDDPWYEDQKSRTFIPTYGHLILNEGEATGRLLGGNLCTLNLLQGTEYMPPLAGSILLLEDDFESGPLTFDRDLQSLLHLPGADQIRGLIIGRFQKASEMSDEALAAIIRGKKELRGVPVLANASFGHTTPQFTFPIGGRGRLVARDGRAAFTIGQRETAYSP